MKQFELQNLDYPLCHSSTCLNKYKSKYYDGTRIVSNVEYVMSSTYTNPEKNASVMFEQIRFCKKDFLKDCTEICEHTYEDDLARLVEYMNNHDNFTIYWSHHLGVTADFVIIQGEYLTDYNAIHNVINKAYGCKHYKYRIITKSKFGIYRAEKFI